MFVSVTGHNLAKIWLNITKTFNPKLKPSVETTNTEKFLICVVHTFVGCDKKLKVQNDNSSNA